MRYSILLLLTCFLASCTVFGSSAAPEPQYQIVSKMDNFEIRDYPELVVVSTTMDSSNSAFRRLFNYISGENEGNRSVAMTAPVIQSSGGQEIAMTAPVIQSESDAENRSMIFVLPQKFSIETAPIPTNPEVTLTTIPSRRLATLTFSGRLTRDAVSENREILGQWMSENALTLVGPAESAGYNPPWTLPAFRRNEILIPIEKL